MNLPIKYDYIIAGAGCAGLSLAVHMIESGRFSEKKILLLEKDLKKANDRTWCFWQKDKTLFDPIVHREWQKLWIHSKDLSRLLDIAPYHYKMIRGIDFYNYCYEKIHRQKNFTVANKKLDHVFSIGNSTGAVAEGETIKAEYIFNSIVFEKPVLANEHWLLQHFKGWIIETELDSFDPACATLMDFRTEQRHATAFCYVLPLSARQALIEYTLFSKEKLNEDAYEQGLRSYISEVLNLNSYKIIHEEFGVIPMTDFKFPSRQNNIINIGTAGGQTKGSSGYTFNFIQKHSARLVQQLIENGHPFLPPAPRRFAFYDSVLLSILKNNRMPGEKIFTRLFKGNKPARLLKFLDNETSLREDVQIISTLPVLPFTKAAIRSF